MIKYSYKYHGLPIASEIELPELTPSKDITNHPLTIRLGNVPDHLNGNQVSHKVCNQIAKGRFLQTIPGIADYYAYKGKEIIISPSKNADMAAVRLFLLTSVIAAILYQRGNLLLQASVLEKNDRAFIITGKSGTGNSATVAGLLPYGYRLVSDDICCITQSDNRYVVSSGAPSVKLWPDIYKRLISSSFYQKCSISPVRHDHKKLQVFLSQTDAYYSGPPLPIKKIYFLNRHTSPCITEAKGFEVFSRIRRVAYREGVLKAEQLEPAFFKFAEQMIHTQNIAHIVSRDKVIVQYENFIKQMHHELMKAIQ